MTELESEPIILVGRSDFHPMLALSALICLFLCLMLSYGFVLYAGPVCL